MLEVVVAVAVVVAIDAKSMILSVACCSYFRLVGRQSIPVLSRSLVLDKSAQNRRCNKCCEISLLRDTYVATVQYDLE